MKWIEVSINTTPAGIEPVTGRLYRLGIQGVEIFGDEDGMREALEQHAQYWDYVDIDDLKRQMGPPMVKAYVADSEAGAELLAAIRAAIGQLRAIDSEGDFGSLTVKERVVQEEDWANNWKVFFKPLPVGEKILVLPSWEDEPKNHGRHVLRIDPGMVFGTGTHETTQLCMEAMERWMEPGECLLDLGCGSGILSVAGLLLGAEKAVGVDIDDNASRVVEENRQMNGIGSDKFLFYGGDLIEDAGLRQKLGAGYGAVLANIVADVIIPLTPHVPGFLRPGGVYIVSGVIESRKEDVRAALESAGFGVVDECQKADWVSMVAKKP